VNQSVFLVASQGPFLVSLGENLESKRQIFPKDTIRSEPKVSVRISSAPALINVKI